MIKIVFYLLVILCIPSGIVLARMLWKAGNLKLRAIEKKQLRDEFKDWDN